MDEIDYLCDLALKFSEVNRTGVQLHSGAPESDTDHTVMLGWVACSFAAKHYPELDQGLIAQFALVHDSPEIYAGDVQSLGMDEETAKNKAQAEHAAVDRLQSEFHKYSWLTDTLALYEQQQLPEARYVRAIDKVLPKIVAYINDYKWHMENWTWQSIEKVLNDQYKQISQYAGEFTKLMELYTRTAYRVIKDVHRKQLKLDGVIE
jgi:5'-deoxynucleotidase YfbR-like HD superfamily hydrolase